MDIEVKVANAIASANRDGLTGPDWRLHPMLMVESAVQMLGRDKYSMRHIAHFLEAPYYLIVQIAAEYCRETRRISRQYRSELKVLNRAVNRPLEESKSATDSAAALLCEILKE